MFVQRNIIRGVTNFHPASSLHTLCIKDTPHPKPPDVCRTLVTAYNFIGYNVAFSESAAWRHVSGIVA
jgi:hypothetical protein